VISKLPMILERANSAKRCMEAVEVWYRKGLGYTAAAYKGTMPGLLRIDCQHLIAPGTADVYSTPLPS